MTNFLSMHVENSQTIQYINTVTSQDFIFKNNLSVCTYIKKHKCISVPTKVYSHPLNCQMIETLVIKWCLVTVNWLHATR